MSSYAKILSLSYDSAVATKASALKTYWRSVRLIKEDGATTSIDPSYITNILLNGKCIDPETRCLYVFYIDTERYSAWIIEINIDTRVQTVVYYDQYNDIGFNAKYKFNNPRVVHGRLVWTDNLNPIYQMDIARAKKSFLLGIGYGQYPQTLEWSAIESYDIDQIVSNGNGYYKSLLNANVGNEPKSDAGTAWLNLKCLIEDAYYSMDVKNFYFEAAPPKHPPVVTYESDDTRKINNLRQTLFQVAYRYVYMDWRKSTFSPASIIPVPQAEEETATGLANEMVSLNNKLRITFDTGGEEVRAIEVIGRSSQDTSKWFLIETINKFEEQERGNEISRTTEAGYVELALSVPLPSVENSIESLPEEVGLGLTPLTPDVFMSYVSTIPAIAFGAAEEGYDDREEIIIDCSPVSLFLTSFPSWLTLRNGGGFDMSAGMTMVNGEVIAVFPATENTAYVARSGYIVLTNSYGDSSSILVSQAAASPPPPVAIVCTVQKDPDDASPQTITNNSASAMSQSRLVTLVFRTDNSDYNPGDTFTMYWRADIGVLPYGGGSFSVTNGTINYPVPIALNRNLVAGETVDVYLSAVDIQKAANTQIPLGLTPIKPSIVNSSVAASANHLIWTAAEFGVANKEDLIMEALPYNAYMSAKPDWLTVNRNGDYPMSEGMYFNDGDTLEVYPTEENIGGAKPSAPITFMTDAGDTISVWVEQSAAVVIPPSDVTCYVSIDMDEPTDLRITSGAGVVASGGTVIRVTGTISYDFGNSDPFILWWKITVNGVTRGHNATSQDVYNGAFDRYFAADVAMYTGDTVRVYLSTVEIT